MKPKLMIGYGLGVIAAVTLMLELVLMRAFDAMINNGMSHLIITCAMFSFGLSGVYAALRPLHPNVDVDAYVAKLSIGFGVFALALLPLLNLNPFNYSQFGESPWLQGFYFALMYLTLMVPFCLSGLIFTTIFSSYAGQIRTLYAFDLCGAAVGCVAFIPFIPRIGPGGLLFTALSLSFIAAVLFLGKLGKPQLGLLAVALLAAVVPFLRTGTYFDFEGHEEKRGVMWSKNHGMLETTRWDPVAKIEVVREKPRLGINYARNKKTHESELFYKHVAYDGGEQGSKLYRFDGNYEKLRADLERNPNLFTRNFWNRGVVASHWFRADQNSEVLVIGSAAGQETKAALLYNPRSVDTVEMVKAVVDLTTHEYSDFIGNIFNDRRVRPHVGEGRTFLRRAKKKYDIIQIFSNHTSSAMAAGGGAGRGVYLQTVEAYEEYFSALKPDGLLQINHHFYPRVITTAARAWKESGRTDFRSHVMVYELNGVDTIPLVLFKMTPWTKEDVAKLNGLMLRREGRKGRYFTLSEDPLNPAGSFLSDDFYSGTLPPELVERVPYRITPPTDDQPYFNFLRKRLRTEEIDAANFVNESAAGMLNDPFAGSPKYDRAAVKPGIVIPPDISHYLLSGAVGLFFAVLFIVVPLFHSSVGRQRWPGELTSLSYFSLLGVGFILIELTFVQIFMKLIGVPLYTYSTVIFTMLAAAGLGSNMADELRVSPSGRWWLPYVGTLVLGALLLAVYSPIFDHFLSAKMPIRILVSALLLLPVSFFMGMCLPLGVLVIKNKPTGAIAWAWGMNGLFTTIGGLVAGLLSMFCGLRMTLMFALSVYFVAGLAFARLKKLGRADPSPSVLHVSEPAISGSA